MSNFCKNCGNQIKNSQKFCNYCGISLTTENYRKSSTYAEIGLIFGVFFSIIFLISAMLSIISNTSSGIILLLFGVAMLFSSLVSKFSIEPNEDKNKTAERYQKCAAIILVSGFLIFGAIPALFLFLAANSAFKENKMIN